MISKTLGTSSRKFANLRDDLAVGLFAQALYPLIVASSDDFGRLQADPFTVKHSVWSTAPENEEVFGRGLDALERVGLIHRYRVNSGVYLQVVDFEAHQQGLHKRTASKYPNPPEIPGDSLLIEEKRTEEKRTEECTEASSVPAFLSFPVIGTGNSVWQLSEAQVAEWAGLFPGLDVRGEARKALAWVGANQGRRKTARGMARFLVGWLTRAVDRGGPRAVVKADVGRAQHEWECPHDAPTCTERWRCDQRSGIEAYKRSGARA